MRELSRGVSVPPVLLCVCVRMRVHARVCVCVCASVVAVFPPIPTVGQIPSREGERREAIGAGQPVADGGSGHHRRGGLSQDPVRNRSS